MERSTERLVEEVVHRIRMNSFPPGSPVSTTADLAEELDVTAQTIRNHIDDVLAYPGVETRKVRGASIYWFEKEDAIQAETPQFGGIGGTLATGDFLPNAWERRGHWEGMRKHIRKDAAAGASPKRRAVYLWELFRTTTQMTVPLIHEVNQHRIDGDGDFGPEVPEEFYEFAEPQVSSKTMKYYLDERPLFNTESYGEVTGILEFHTYEYEVEDAFENDVGAIELDELDNETIDAWVPECEEILDTGDALVDLVSEIYGWRW